WNLLLSDDRRTDTSCGKSWVESCDDPEDSTVSSCIDVLETLIPKISGASRGKQTYGHLNNLYKLSSVYRNNALDKAIYENLKNLLRFNRVYGKNALDKKTYGHLKDQSKKKQRLQQQRTRQEILRTPELPDNREQRLCVDRSQHVSLRQTSMRKGLYLKAFRYDPTKDYWIHPKAAICKMNIIYKYCRAKNCKCEALGMCCSNGKVKLPSLDSPPKPFYSLIFGVTL
ncbi:hypothetical protein AVEN_63329-1, partial [Araneus ventricosus]